MRLLHRLRQGYAIWPFDAAGDRTVVEIYARAFLRLAGGRGTKVRDRASLDRALDDRRPRGEVVVDRRGPGAQAGGQAADRRLARPLVELAQGLVDDRLGGEVRLPTFW